MRLEVEKLLQDLEVFGLEHDYTKETREERLRNVSKEMGQFLSILVKMREAKHILEIGTSNGFSTLWLANAAEETKGTVTTVELSSKRVAEANENFQKANLTNYIHIHNQEAGAFLSEQLDKSYDFIFLDAERTQYIWWWEDIKRILIPKGIIVVDNATSHAEELQNFFDLVEEEKNFETVLLPFKMGAYVMRKLN
ncbi:MULTISPECIES: O-methyltransferase [unclassified Bacillus (in: firmicutes)]|uniref:O-methyltransferase n=1 Tax=unclassified Bacillus (in: firmicutes) TaxID=185979 RepID=UPI0008E54A7B|nr:MULTISPECIES: O-methyltransferase [unclassified Bacillus (in: firmicutes)]SFH98461.1 Predicted O-methyltransferase YrrM [Bacillus sp. 71mf]SFS93803.1 Predicted O-methyltransferase YrrM [Bacillus sp. 103mf]